ncbi:mitochondrial ribonuclease P catalytic subunit [Lampris incognitus]|uniref:mitochondrial ribonuclease P catalytic subunit n=1 Tax=Lampris incognitus TaxID=2546036 RepID=UPI0024B62291|nr:mitochondrial ribonuclease P catalytic subunit [Lampris incognitus]
MCSTLISKANICVKHLNPLFHQGRSDFCTLRAVAHFSKSAKPPAMSRTLCTNGSVPKGDSSPLQDNRETDSRKNRQADGQSLMKNKTSSHGETERRVGTKEGKGRNFTLQQRLPKSLFAAGTAKRTAEMLKRKASMASVDEEQVEMPTERQGRRAGKWELPDKPLSVVEWKKLKEASDNPQRFDMQMMSSLFESRAELDIAKSLLTFVAVETGTLSYQLLLRYLALCVSGGHDAEVSDVYGIMRGTFQSLDTGASSLFMKTFSRTDRWREAIHLLHDMKKVITPSVRNYGDVIAGTLLHGDVVTAWALYDEVIEKGLSPCQETWDALFKGGTRERKEEEGEKETRVTESLSQSHFKDRLLDILIYMRNNQAYPQHSLASTIKTWFESLPEEKWRGIWTTITPKGVCKCCGSELESIQLNTEEYQQLKDRVMTNIIQGQDVFKKTTPEELERFKMFVKKRPAFDMVVDGLNVANITKLKQSETLLAVVSELERQGQTVLVLGRKHMLHPSKTWERNDMYHIKQKAHCFFTDNISEDDPFLLYATLHSGNHCRFLSRDLMRDHKACLPDGMSRRLFFKWQRGHQLVVDGRIMAARRVRFQTIPSFDTIIQTTGNSWHIPYDDSEDRSSYEVPQKWLCLTKTR